MFFALAAKANFVRIVLVRDQRSEGLLSRVSIEDRGSALGWERSLDANSVNGSFAQKAYFAKSRERPKITARVGPARCDAASPKADIDTLLQHY
jgi:hypothetical protein